MRQRKKSLTPNDNDTKNIVNVIEHLTEGDQTMNHRKQNIPQGTRTCAYEGCIERNCHNSKYCGRHKEIARQKYFEMLNNKKNQRERLYEAYARAATMAKKAGKEAGNKCVPVPMVVQQHADMFNDHSPVIKTYEPVSDGVCGFGYVVVTPGNSSLAIWLKKHQDYFHWYYGGMAFGVKEFGQSYERKMAYAKAYADVMIKELKSIIPNNIRIRPYGRLD